MHLSEPRRRDQLGRAALGVLVIFQTLALLYFVIPLDAISSLQSYLPIPASTFGHSVQNPENGVTKASTQADDEDTPAAPPSSLHQGVRFIMTFGDSYSRTGFEFNKTGPGSEFNPSASNPFGNPEWPGNCTSKGKNWIGYMASEFNSTLTLAWTFGSGGSVIDPSIVPPRPSRSTFVKQVQEFNASIGHRPAHAPWTPENAVAGMWFGSNDMTHSWKYPNLTVVMPNLVDGLLAQAQVLHSIGIRNFLFFELTPLAWSPTYQKFPSRRRNMAAYFVGNFNILLQSRVEVFKEKNRDSRVNIVPITDVFMGALLDPHSRGAPNATCLDLLAGKDCLWADGTHPGISIHRSIGQKAAELAWG